MKTNNQKRKILYIESNTKMREAGLTMLDIEFDIEKLGAKNVYDGIEIVKKYGTSLDLIILGKMFPDSAKTRIVPVINEIANSLTPIIIITKYRDYLKSQNEIDKKTIYAYLIKIVMPFQLYEQVRGAFSWRDERLKEIIIDNYNFL